ncbi:hypothetical protein Zmor_025592 [Zophobas morio]|uniref:Uncharacterized protein n=1 Tax=Zophobas morio TaxID=2755281 RepID=A0AA38HS88_9CUCU|nr:hypothetical protein Zmor_025592 [Zophobas morio]
MRLILCLKDGISYLVLKMSYFCFMLQFKVLYNNHQKQLRIQEIEERMTELAVNLHTVEGVANSTNVLIGKLRRTVRQKSRRGKFKS